MLENVGFKQVDTAVDDVAHKSAGLFNIMQDLKNQTW